MGVKIVHVHDGRVPLVEGPLVVNKRLGSFLIRRRLILHRPGPFHWLDVRTEYQPIKGPLGTMNHRTSLFGPRQQTPVASIREALTDASSTRGCSPVGVSSSNAAKAFWEASWVVSPTAYGASRTCSSESMVIIAG